MMKFYSTTIIGVRRDEKVALGSDGQVTFGDTIMKHSSSKVRKIYGDRVLVGFAGASADAFALFEKFEGKLDEFKGNIQRAAVELAKLWRTDKYLRRLEALLTVMDKEKMLVISGTGDVIEPDDNVIAIGSGGPYAAAAARALLRHTSLTAREIVEESLRIAAEICVYTNNKFTILEL
ncbi:MAG: HslU--HslV peptidase proteolytic subunit [Candidatus Neomarinimicrobiota bacterium]|nr:MAG: HslU--HslV peptidase proteolytic subunit [Candidatus Neomarinimicrobiota bacterium]RKY50294.1 MAG: HslU--HslV peptidase proteolytic subunit [Candidatus Neomarinimicrobiota bacterium]HDN59867.1 ATP-dependent protease subunit HslV [Candidatus Neomarinimicrobiota bacterium]